MTLQLISNDSFPTYIALSTDITSGSTISGASQIGKTVYTTDTQSWYIITGSSLILNRFYLPIFVSACISGVSASSLGSMAYQSASAVIITGGSIVAGNARFGNAEGSAYFESDGTLIFSGSATVWDDIFFPLLTAKQGQTDKPAFDANDMGYLFPSSDTSQLMYIVGQLPHTRKQYSTIYPHVHWNQNHSGSVVFKMDYKWFPIGGSVPASWDTYIMNTHAALYTSGSLHQLNYGANGISGSMIVEDQIGVSSMILMKLYRDDNTYTGNAITYQLDLHYEKDSLGSHQQFIK